ncbi:MAG: histidine kinase, partial [Opitutus sp.]
PSHNFNDTGNGAIKRAGFFFTQALTPLEIVQRATRKEHRALERRNEVLRRHASELAAGNRRLKKEVTRRRAAELVILEAQARYQKLFRESQIMQRKLRELTHQIILAQEEERKQISRELHDEVVQTLVGINVELSALLKRAPSALQSLRTKITQTQRLVESSVNAVHRFARDLRPAVLDDLGLIPALHAYSKTLAARKKIRIQLTAFAGVEALDISRRTMLYRVALEALTNVVRHADASQVRITISEGPGVVRMEISDNGKSFVVEKALLANPKKRLGLIGMTERVEMVGGRFAVESIAGQGTTIRAEIPFQTKPSKP